MFSALLFMFFFFFGILAVLFYLLKRQEQAWQTLRDEHAQLRVLMRSLESRLEFLATVSLDPNLAQRAEQTPEQGDKPGADPLLRLSFEEPESPPAQGNAAHDPALELHFAPDGDALRR